MKFWVIAVSHKLPSWAETATAEYLKRMPSDCGVVIKEIKPDAHPSKEKEAQKIREHVPKNAYLVALDERGKDLSSQAFAQQFSGWRELGKDVAFVIGGADGLDDSLRNEADQILRLSSMTLPHAMARVVLAEQLYRAWTMLNHHPYHRA